MATVLTVTPIPSTKMEPLGNGLYEVTGTLNMDEYTTNGAPFTYLQFGLGKWTLWEFTPMIESVSSEVLQIIPDITNMKLEVFVRSDASEEGNATDLSAINFPFRIQGYIH